MGETRSRMVFAKVAVRDFGRSWMDPKSLREQTCAS
jgi:hypothetical protein